MSDEKPAALEPLYNLKALVKIVDAWAKRHRIGRAASNDVGIALERVCERYEQDRQASASRIAELEAMRDEQREPPGRAV